MLDVDLTSWILADVSLHEYLLVLDPEFLIQKIVEKVTTKKQVIIAEEIWDRKNSEIKRTLNILELYIRHTQEQKIHLFVVIFSSVVRFGERVLAFETAMVPCIFLKELIKFYFSCLIFCGFHY